MRKKKCLQKFHSESLGKLGDSCGEVATLPFMNWIGLHIDFVDSEKLVNVCNLHLRLACTSTFFMPCEICKNRYVVLLKIFEKLDHVSTFGWESGTCLEMLLGPLLVRSLDTSAGTIDYTSKNKLQPIRELSELCA
ncbi:hypothetical protein EJD97_016918 [Solanum chilense]|uniref:Uncharacterized protein n=1 Tax=Solanum chilense TaxID=4083 RepID=A0A6N2B6F3_SOLCI|nr:hypothetical protein EJD97_016918 [Solanum chilense]